MTLTPLVSEPAQDDAPLKKKVQNTHEKSRPDILGHDLTEGSYGQNNCMAHE
jgi:hypothetical protein